MIAMQCPKCNKRYNNKRSPLVFTCGHTFCSECINSKQNISNTNKSQFKNQAESQCFTCKIIEVPKKNLALQSVALKDKNVMVDKFIKICIFGNAAVGKTSLIKQLQKNEYDPYVIPTIGSDLRIVDRQIKDIFVRFQLWDSSGQERFKASAPMHYKNADFAIFVYDVCESFEINSVEQWLNQVQNYLDCSKHLIFVGNKADLLTQHSIKDDTYEQVNILAKNMKRENFLVSCTNGSGVSDLWNYIDKQSYLIKKASEFIKSNIEKEKSIINQEENIEKDSHLTEPKQITSTSKLRAPKKQEKKQSCC